MLRILIVEDEDIIRKGLVYTTDWLSMDCVVVAEAANGQEGYEKILEYRPDVVIADIYMPYLDGIEMMLAELSADLGEAMVGINEQEIALLMAERGK